MHGGRCPLYTNGLLLALKSLHEINCRKAHDSWSPGGGAFNLPPSGDAHSQPSIYPAVVDRPKPVLPPPGVKHLEKVEDLVLEITNQARRAKGLAPLIKDDELRDVARAYSDDMLVRRFFDHTTPDGVSFDERIADRYRHRVRIMGENIWYASGYNPSNTQRLAKEIVDDWMSSPGHRDNLLSPDFTHLG